MALSKEEKTLRKEERRMKRWLETHKIIFDVDHKRCNKCNKYYPSTNDYFYVSKGNEIDGLYPYCIECAKISATQWAIEHPDKVREYDNRKKYSQPLRRIRSREAATKNRIEGYQRDWRSNNRDKVNNYTRIKRMTRTHNISIDEWDHCRLYFDYRCAYCGITYEEQYLVNKQDFHQEHVDDDGLNDLSNCVPSCRSCNSQKWNYDFDEWYNEKNKKYSADRYNKIVKWLDSDYKAYITK